jgi:hypothetical protein
MRQIIHIYKLLNSSQRATQSGFPRY